MGEAVSTAALTVEDIGEKFPESKSEIKFLVPLQDACVKIGEKHRFSIQGRQFILRCMYNIHCGKLIFSYL